MEKVPINEKAKIISIKAIGIKVSKKGSDRKV